MDTDKEKKKRVKKAIEAERLLWRPWDDSDIPYFQEFAEADMWVFYYNKKRYVS